MLTSKHRLTTYRGVPELAASGLHAHAFELFRRHVTPGARVLDLGSGAGAWATRLHDAGYKVTACDLVARNDLEFPYQEADLNGSFGSKFKTGEFDAISFVEVIEHLENPRHIFRQLVPLMKDGGTLLLTTPNASGVYSRVRFFFTGQMSMFTDEAYGIGHGHITPMTAWQLEKVFMEHALSIVERTFHDAPFLPPRSQGDVAKVAAWMMFRMFMFGTVGGQNIMYVVRKNPSA
ncbi:MAG: class I SAM-dependent methyltransferase [Vicinamibacterales bacterium]